MAWVRLSTAVSAVIRAGFVTVKVQSISAAVATQASPDKLYFSGLSVSVITHHRVSSEPVPPVVGCCQTNANQSLFPSNLNLLGCAEAAPLGKSSGAVELEI